MIIKMYHCVLRKKLFVISDVIQILAIVSKSPHSPVLFLGLVETASGLQTQLRQPLHQNNVSVYSTAKSNCRMRGFIASKCCKRILKNTANSVIELTSTNEWCRLNYMKCVHAPDEWNSIVISHCLAVQLVVYPMVLSFPPNTKLFIMISTSHKSRSYFC